MKFFQKDENILVNKNIRKPSKKNSYSQETNSVRNAYTAIQ